MNLVVVESPSKAKTIGKYLGKDYIVKASKGHVVDLPKSGLAIDVKNNFEPEYVVTNAKSLKEIKDSIKKADKLILAVDLDREGEAIAWHIARELKFIDKEGKTNKKNTKPYERIVFSEITKDAIQGALKSPRDIDLNLVNAQQARRLLDRLVGYKLSPVLWKKISFGLSAGRVQSVALRLVVDREEERNAFNPEEYWDVTAFLTKNSTANLVLKTIKVEDKEKAKLEGESENLLIKEKSSDERLIKFLLDKINGKKPELAKEEDTKNILSVLEKSKWIISDIQEKEFKKSPKAPFITSTLQQASINKFGFTGKKTMMIAQKLYESGLITYMRTDSYNIGAQAIDAIRSHIKKDFGEKYLSSKVNVYSKSVKNAQEAHECIRPTDISKSGAVLNLESDAEKLYNLIRNRTLACQMSSAEFIRKAVFIEIEQYTFKANGSTLKFDGYLRAYSEKFEDKILPELRKGEEIYADSIFSVQHFTQPPARYSEASLIKKMEEIGIGRPSTYSSIISTLLSRKYVISENKYLTPTDTGTVVNKLLVKYFPKIVDYNFTAEMENSLDSIAEGKTEWKKMLSDFYLPFEIDINKTEKDIPRSEFTELGESEEKCPKCGGPMKIKLGRYGRFLSCANYPECDGILRIEDGSDSAAAAELNLEKYEGAPKTDDGRDYELKTGRYGKFWAHPDYPKVKDIKSLLLKEKCPLSGHNLVERKGKFGKSFIGCSDYPNCKFIQKTAKSKDIEASSDSQSE